MQVSEWNGAVSMSLRPTGADIHAMAAGRLAGRAVGYSPGGGGWLVGPLVRDQACTHFSVRHR